MNENIDLNQIEKQAYLSYHQDGILDICIGSALVNLWLVIWLLPEFWYFIVGGLIVWVTVYTGAKKAFTVPRMGYVEFSSIRRRRIQNILLVGVLILVCSNILAILAIIHPPLGILIFESLYTILLIGIIGTLIVGFIGHMLNMRRFYSYGAVFFATSIFTFFVPSVLILPLIVLSIVILTFGLVLLYRFLRKYPKLSSGEVAGA